MSVISSNLIIITKLTEIIILDSKQLYLLYFRRLVSEMIHIKRQNCGLNMQNDINRSPDIYLSIN